MWCDHICYLWRWATLLPCLFWASGILFYCILNNLVETKLFSLAPSSQNGSLEAWYQTSEGQYKILFPTIFSVYFSLQVLYMTWKHICTVRGCIRCDHFTGREAIWQVLPVSTTCGRFIITAAFRHWLSDLIHPEVVDNTWRCMPLFRLGRWLVLWSL